MRTLLLRIYGHLSRRRRIQLAFLLALMLTSGVAELVSLGAVLPFLAVLSDPERLWQLPLVQSLACRLGVTTANHLLLPVTLIFASAALLAMLIRLVNLWLNGRFAAAVGSDLSCKVYCRTLYQPYQVHVRRNSSTMITVITDHVDSTVLALNALLQIFTAFVVAIGLLTGLLLIDWLVALASAGLFGLAYVFVAAISRRQLVQNGRLISDSINQRIKALQEGLGSIRDVLLNCSQATYLEVYRNADRTQRQLQCKNVFLSMFPRYALEALGLVVIAFLGFFLVMQRGGGVIVISLLGAFALGAQRLLPALQQIYSGWAYLNGWNSSLVKVLELLDQPMPFQHSLSEPFQLKQSLRFETVRFSYTPENEEVLKGIDLEIRHGERVGFIGSTGSGKSTLVDVLMGLLIPTSGILRVDGLDLHDPKHEQQLVGWRAAVAHVPQNIYLCDSSFAENIAFGVPRHMIDLSRVKQAAELAHIAGFIESSLEGYASFVGERGIRLSGGQRQRIGIARALYKQASLLVLDEATSALDNKTEESVMNAVENLSRDLTIVMIAHRTSTLDRCDRIVRIERGTVFEIGSPRDVLDHFV